MIETERGKENVKGEGGEEAGRRGEGGKRRSGGGREAGGEGASKRVEATRLRSQLVPSQLLLSTTDSYSPLFIPCMR